jgi:hypothetical protein
MQPSVRLCETTLLDRAGWPSQLGAAPDLVTRASVRPPAYSSREWYPRIGRFRDAVGQISAPATGQIVRESQFGAGSNDRFSTYRFDSTRVSHIPDTFWRSAREISCRRSTRLLCRRFLATMPVRTGR